MSNSSLRLLLLAVLTAAAVIALLACAQVASGPAVHPVSVEGFPICRDCHADWRAGLDHTPEFINRHGLSALQHRRACESCHKPSFCGDCHAHKEELKPSDKEKEAVKRTMPHPGDYLTQHRIDGRINPASCFPCHGRMNNERCRVCHK